MLENVSVKDPTVVDALFQELSSWIISPERLDFATGVDVPIDRMMAGGFGDVRPATLHPASEPLQADGTRLCGGAQHITVAVKRLKNLDQIDLPRRKLMVVREIHLLSKVQHPYIVPFRGFHVDFERSVACLISDWEPFGNLLDYLRDHEATITQRLQLLQDTVIALAYLHSLDPLICHGDIKAANVLVNQDRRAMLCDFGLARIIEDEGFKSLETSAEFRGSLPWCSPELFDGQRSSPQSDMWAFGCLVWEVATQTTPFSNLPSKLAIMAAICHHRLPQPQQQPFFRQVPQLTKFLNDCWHRNPAARPSARDGCSTLTMIINHQEIRRRRLGPSAKFQGSWISRAFSVVSGRRDSPSHFTPRMPEPQRAAPVSPLNVQAVLEYFIQDSIDTLKSQPGAEVRRILDRIDYTGRLENITGIAQGGFSDVKRGQVKENGTDVAIKTLVARMARELLLWFDLRHPHVLPLVGFAFIDGMPCLLSMWCENGNVAQYLPATPRANRKRLVHQVALGLGYLHSKGVIHADIKPINILVDDSENVRISDFGASKRQDIGWAGETSVYIPVQTVVFDSPEIFLEKPLVFSSDVYSFACIMLEILTGRSPFWYFEYAAMVLSRVSRREMPSRSKYPELPDSHWSLMTQCWAFTPAERPSMTIVIKELKKLGFDLN